MHRYIKYNRRYWTYIKTTLYTKLWKNKYLNNFVPYKSAFSDKLGIEIGGPSGLFSSEFIPIYQLAVQIDGCNFSNNTVWEGDILSDIYNYHPKKAGKQIIAEGSDLSDIRDERYDFVLSCHNLEHFANPFKALKEWYRILKKGGTMLLVLPDKRYTFDWKREYTPFDHILGDYKNNTSENDLTHLDEILKKHDLKMDPGAGDDFSLFKIRCENNYENRCIHHHVFSDAVLKKLLNTLNMRVDKQYYIPPINKIIIGTKL